MFCYLLLRWSHDWSSHHGLLSNLCFTDPPLLKKPHQSTYQVCCCHANCHLIIMSFAVGVLLLDNYHCLVHLVAGPIFCCKFIFTLNQSSINCQTTFQAAVNMHRTVIFMYVTQLGYIINKLGLSILFHQALTLYILSNLSRQCLDQTSHCCHHNPFMHWLCKISVQSSSC